MGVGSERTARPGKGRWNGIAYRGPIFVWRYGRYSIVPHGTYALKNVTPTLKCGATFGAPLRGESSFIPTALPLGIVHFLEDPSRIWLRLCRVVYADTPLRRHADTVAVFGCGSAPLRISAVPIIPGQRQTAAALIGLEQQRLIYVQRAGGKAVG
jgi:hypothetical protein